MKRDTSNRFQDKEFYYRGVLIEEIPSKETLMHYDDAIIKRLVYAVMCQALKDWEGLNRGGIKRNTAQKGESTIFRAEVVKFFNSTFCRDILNIIVPDVDTEDAIKSMSKYPIKIQQLGWERGTHAKNR